MSSDIDRLRLAFANICDGYSIGSVFNQTIYIKHLGYREHTDIEKVKKSYENEARESGLQTNQERLDFLRKTGQWGDKEEHDIVVQESSIDRFREAKKKVVLPSMLKQYDDEIAKQTALLETQLNKKNSLIGLTVESHAEKLVSDYYILKNIFLDSELKKPFFDIDEFDNLSDSDVSDIIFGYNEAINICSDINVKKLAVQDFYQEYYFLCGDDISSFFGKPVINLTYLQIKLGNYSKYFKSIFENHDLSRLPKDKRHDPDAIEDFLSTSKNAKNILDSQKGGSVGIVGATKEDLRSLGLDKSIAKMPDREMNKDELFDFFSKK